ncbi:ABC transporter substrate-binding protein [Actinomadura physcomitrii]|uniref:ABC transporter substrate-binding protein n=1 Tax=Actinomadura physcomitrii TaxID=2650748 RepID=UPI00136C491A|nr:ABC transporter substrate-binding protein [Actinomadura physcomitrii]
MQHENLCVHYQHQGDLGHKETIVKHHPFRLAAIGASALLLAGCGSAGNTGGSNSSGSGDPIRIAIVYGVTGAFAGFAKDFLTGVNAAKDSINAAGGVNGRKIEVDVLDDKSNPTTGVSVLTKALTSSNPPDAVVPGGVSTEVLAMLPAASSRGLFSIAPASDPSINKPSSYPYHFGTFAVPQQNLTAIGAGFKANGTRTLGVITSSDAFGDAVLGGIQNVAKDAGVKIVATERPDPTSLNFDVQYQRVMAAKPDAVFFDFASQDAVGRLLASRVTVGATGTPVYGGSAAAATPLGKSTDPAALKSCQIPVYRFTIASASPPAYLAPLLKAFKGSKDSILSGGLGWDTVKLVALAAQRAGKDTGGKALAAALLSSPVPANVLALFPGGVGYTKDNHFPTPGEGTFGQVPCGATLQDGQWAQVAS